MQTDSDRKVQRFKQALRIYNSCSPHCEKDHTNIQVKHDCYQQCTKRHVELENKMRVTLKFNIE